MVIRNKIGFIDIEYNYKNGLILIGFYDNKYLYFTEITDFYDYIFRKYNKITIFGFNLEYDFSILLKKIPKNSIIEVNYNSKMIKAVIKYGKKRIILKDLFCHYSKSLKDFGEIIGLNKLEIDYNFNKIDEKLIEYNKRDIEITKKLYNELIKIYKELGSDIRNTIGGVAFNLYKRRYYLPIIPDEMKNIFITAYRGGEVWALKGKYKGKIFMIDVNSLYPYVMAFSKMPEPTSYFYSEKPEGKMYLILTERRAWTNYDWAIKKPKEKILGYICFKNYIYPFKEFILWLNDKKEKAKNNFERYIYKNLMNSLYGKFAEKIIPIKIIYAEDERKIPLKNVVSIEQYPDTNFYRVEYEPKFLSTSNVIYSVFITARARYYMNRFMRLLNSRGIKVIYQDTDAFIVLDDNDKLKELKKYFDDKKIGKFKIEYSGNYAIIVGKKLYMLEDIVKAKGIPKNKAKEFIEKGKTEYDKILKLREALRRKMVDKIGDFILVSKENRTNKVLDNTKENDII